MSRTLRPLFTIIGDIAIFYGALVLTLLVRYGSRFDYTLYQRHILPFSYILIIWLLTFYVAGLYDRRMAFQRFTLSNLIIQTLVIAGLLAAAFFYVTTAIFFEIKPLTVLVLQILIFGLLLLGWRYLLYYFGQKEGLAQKVLFVGGGTLADEISKEINTRPELGLKVVSASSASGSASSALSQDYRQICQAHKVDTIVVSSDALRQSDIVAKLYECLPLQVRFIDLPSFYEQVSGKIPVDAIGQAWFLEKISLHRRTLYDILKRVADIILAIILLVITAVLFPFIALAIKLDSKGSVLFKNDRVGAGGKTFYIYKFRTMVNNAEPDGKAVWSGANDNRITKVGSFLRKTRLDELPQAWNMLKGDLSFVGPRPERPEFVNNLTQKIPFYGERHLVKPGLTGWAQISLPYDASEAYTREKLQYDLYYIKNRSLLLDIGVVLKTIKSVLTRSGR